MSTHTNESDQSTLPQLLHGQTSRKQDQSYPNMMERRQPVIHEGDMFDTIKEAHLFLNHAGIEPTAKFLAQGRYGVTEDDVAEFQRLCKFCTQNESSHNKAPLHPIVTLRLFKRVQIDLIDFRNNPYGKYKYVLCIKDCFSKYCQLYPMRTKSAAEVAKKFRRYEQRPLYAELS
ncbi:hypothetical protein B0J12DRAFT_209762 [Macrophomina phaseolina]|uniref:Integrase catalytic core n=1 Tax=Macrophomina phaseolina TaxID=35725 RepID=A0ABQ8G1U2_9PEZI|nr:hypothetical protein B0J12DRAFT_209762 [Macrophomina phaseolina]